METCTANLRDNEITTNIFLRLLVLVRFSTLHRVQWVIGMQREFACVDSTPILLDRGAWHFFGLNGSVVYLGSSQNFDSPNNLVLQLGIVQMSL